MDVFPFYHQLDKKDCGPACLRMIAKYYGRNYSLQSLRERSYISREGVSLMGLSEAAESIGFRTAGLRVSLEQLKHEVPMPCILYWNQNHFVVCYGVRKRRGVWHFQIADPARQKIDYVEGELKKCWLSSLSHDTEKGIVLALEPSADFLAYDDEPVEEQGRRLGFFYHYLTPYRKQLVQLILGMLVCSGLQLILPFLTQSLVDVGIRDANLDFIILILVAQVMISISLISVEFIRSWLLLHVNARISIALISDFLIKLMKLPLRFFDTKLLGDIMQRIRDHGRIKSFLMGSSINVLFSIVSFFIFAIVLAYYNLKVLGIFLVGNALYTVWILSFMKYRRELDIKRFEQASAEESNLVQLVTAMQEIKLNNCEMQKRWQWERIQVKLFKIGVRGLALGQVQQVGSIFFHQTTNILISFMAAKAVVDGEMTLGMMMSLTYIIGQLSAPVSSFISFAQQFQDAKISLERLNEVHGKPDEEQEIASKLTVLPEKREINIENLSFSYDGADRDYVLDGISLQIPAHRVTAIVGVSGSGKTTLVKLMLGFYTPNKGVVKVGDTPLENINPHLWRSKTGAVMQDGFIFSETIAQNIAVGEERIDPERLRHAVTVANIRDFIDSLPLGYNTKIGMEGNGISQGQRQRILIARAVYKNPEFLFFDEATNALDVNNEKAIMKQLHEVYKGKTVVVVAHRLSTVREADKIVVLDKGCIAEEGTHEELTARKGLYYQLVKNQLELGN